MQQQKYHTLLKIINDNLVNSIHSLHQENGSFDYYQMIADSYYAQNAVIASNVSSIFSTEANILNSSYNIGCYHWMINTLSRQHQVLSVSKISINVSNCTALYEVNYKSNNNNNLLLWLFQPCCNNNQRIFIKYEFKLLTTCSPVIIRIKRQYNFYLNNSSRILFKLFYSIFISPFLNVICEFICTNIYNYSPQ